MIYMNNNVTITHTGRPFTLEVVFHDENDRTIWVHADSEYGRAFIGHAFKSHLNSVRFYKDSDKVEVF